MASDEKKAEKSQQRVNKAMMSGKLRKYGVTKKTVYSASMLLVTAALVAILTISQAVFDPSKLKKLSYWVELLVLVAIILLSMTLGKQIGDDYYRNNPNGEFRSALSRYSEAMNRVIGDNMFAFLDDWIENFRQRKLLEEKKQYLQDAGISQMEVLDLNHSEIDNLLRDGYRKDWTNTEYVHICKRTQENATYFDQYTPEQVRRIKDCKEGKVKVSRLSKSFFVDAFNQSDRDMWESAAKASKKKGLYLTSNYVYRIAMLVVTSIILNGMSATMVDGANSMQMWFTMISRLWTMMTATVYGIFVGINICKIDMDYLNFKTNIMMQCHEEYVNKIYVPVSVEDKAYVAYQERLKREKSLTIVEGEEAKEVNGNG